MLEDKQKREVRIRCEKRYNEFICHRLISYVDKGLRQRDVIELMDDEMTIDAIKHWFRQLKNL